jgi:type II secretory pathway component PulK
VSETKSVEPATTLGIDTVNLSDLLSVQRLVRQIGGSDKLQQHVKLLEELETKPASELLERFATLVPATN